MRPSAEPIRDQLVPLLPRLRRFARALVLDAQRADDLVRQAVTRALLTLERLPAGTPLESRMFAIVREVWIDQTRSAGPPPDSPTPAEQATQIPDSSSETPIQRLSLETALQLLPEEQRLAVALVLVEGMAYKEAAAVLEVPVEVVRSRLSQARGTLEVLLGAREGEV